MARYWQASGLYRLENADEARALLRGVVEVARSGAAVEPDLEVRSLIALAMIDSREGQSGRALTFLEEARDPSEKSAQGARLNTGPALSRGPSSVESRLAQDGQGRPEILESRPWDQPRCGGMSLSRCLSRS